MTSEETGSVPVDLEGFRQELAEVGAEEILWGVVETFVNDAPSRMEAIDSALQSGDNEQIRTAAHAYKSAAGTMRARELAALLLELETAGGERDLDRALALQAAIRDAHERALEFLADATEAGEGDA